MAFALLSSAGCSANESTTTSAIGAVAATAVPTAVTIRVGWDQHCDVAWTLSYDGSLWKSPTGRMLEEERTGSVESINGDTLRYRDDDGTLFKFVIDDPSMTACS